MPCILRFSRETPFQVTTPLMDKPHVRRLRLQILEIANEILPTKNEEGIVLVFKCSHRFCTDCITKLQKRNPCPLCRSDRLT